MSVVLDGSSQYISLGDAVDIRSATPTLIVMVVDTTDLVSGTRGLFSQGDYSDNRGYGAFLYGGPPKDIGVYGAPAGGSTNELDGSILNIAAASGWFLVCVAIYTGGSAPNISMLAKAQAYSYTSATWGTQEALGGIATGLSTSNLQAPSTGDTTVIGANQITTIHNFWPGKISWIAVFNNDGGGGAGQIKDTAIAAELIANGFWNLLDSNCKLAIAFNNNTTDQSGNGHDGTLVGSPSYGATGPGEVSGGGTTYTDAGQATSAATASTADALTMVDAGQATSATTASGGDQFIPSGTVVDAGQALAAWSGGALDTMTMADAGGGVLVAVMGGLDAAAGDTLPIALTALARKFDLMAPTRVFDLTPMGEHT